MQKKLPKLGISIVVPAYNEEENILFILKDTLKTLPKYFSDYEVIVVNDGSKDKTGKLADQLAQKNKSLRVIHQPNGGYSKAMLTGIKASHLFFLWLPTPLTYSF